MAGNVGTQSLAVTIRVLMDKNLRAKDKFNLIVKEVRDLVAVVAYYGLAWIFLIKIMGIA